MLTFPLHFTAQVLIEDTSIRLSIVVSEAAMPPGKKAPDSQAGRALALAAARTVMRRHFPDHAHSMVIPLPILVSHPPANATKGPAIWDDAGVTISFLEEAHTSVAR